MAKSTFDINKDTSEAGAYRKSVDAAMYRQEGDYFVFYADASHMKKVLTVAASAVMTIGTEQAKV